MSQELIDHSPDLQKLKSEGYCIEIVENGHLVMHDVPYLNSDKKICKGKLISVLDLAGDKTDRPQSHIMYFDGEFPYKSDGTRLSEIENSSQDFNLGNNLTAKHLFSAKPKNGYQDYYEKMTKYSSTISGHAEKLDPSVSPCIYKEVNSNSNTVFNYYDTASSRAGISACSEKLKSEIVAIIGTGGTGSYILDFLAKTWVKEIRLFDGDVFLTHNAFRAPGAPSIEDLRKKPKKVEYLKNVYSNMHKNIISYAFNLDESNLNELEGITFAFISLDSGPNKSKIISKLEQMNVEFIDVGMGILNKSDSLCGILRTSTVTTNNRSAMENNKIPLTENTAVDDLYASNIQVADLNALNATLAIIKWKKIRNFYHDLENEYNSTYAIDGNVIENDIKLDD